MLLWPKVRLELINMKTCVIYAAYIPNSPKLNVIREFFSVFKSQFHDADFYIGINPGSIPNTINTIKEYGLNCQFVNAQENLDTTTDASAYQAALKLLKDSGNKYDVYWFGHTKGGSNPREEERRLYINEFFSKRKEIEDMFEQHPHLGSWGIRGNYMASSGKKWDTYNVDSCISICGNKKFPPFNYTHVNWSYIETMYALKGKPVEEFINIVPDDFFTTKLDPWYFETVMPWVPSRCGYFPYVKNQRCFWNTENLSEITKKWIEENNLNLESYLLL